MAVHSGRDTPASTSVRAFTAMSRSASTPAPDVVPYRLSPTRVPDTRAPESSRQRRRPQGCLNARSHERRQKAFRTPRTVARTASRSSRPNSAPRRKGSGVGGRCPVIMARPGSRRFHRGRRTRCSHDRESSRCRGWVAVPDGAPSAAGLASVGDPSGSAIGCRQQIVRRIARSNRRVSFDVIAPD